MRLSGNWMNGPLLENDAQHHSDTVALNRTMMLIIITAVIAVFIVTD